ncbi:unnamed protein product [Allacma fusca]|uniref:Uncharacterized protein n=1 Tax=Allacma fusca TaxID=39272 RepID=A0A8J2KHU0_9HEXA|nr:unnamed protein product [Allacma fusca]
MILLILYSDAGNYEADLSIQAGGNRLEDGSSPTTISPEITTLSEKAILASTCRKVVMILAKRLLKHLAVCNKVIKKQYPTQEEFTKHFQVTLEL